MYCVYTDRNIDENDGNYDHVVPLSLGGCNQFCIWAEKKFNSKLGEKIDGAIAKDPIVMFARRDADARGHSGVEPVPTWRKSEFEGRPVQVKFGKDGLKIWDAKSRTYLDESIGGQITSSIRIDAFAPLKFAAKVALGGAYYVYGEAILTAVDCDELRKLMTLDVEAARADPHLLASQTNVCDRYHPDSHNNPDGRMYRALCEFSKRSTFICVPHDDAISFHVGVLGAFIASIICPADTSKLPIDAELHDTGHVILLAPGSFERLSLRQLAGRWYKLFTGEDPPPPPL